jgi:hypothetical protein
MGRSRPLPYLLLAILTLGTGLGVGLGISEAPTGPPPAHHREPLSATIPRESAPPSATTSPPSPTTTPAQPVVSVAYVRPGFGVVGIANAPTPLEASLELTTDFVHWRDITPPIPGPDQYGDAYRFTDVSFLNSLQGWVVAYSEASSSLRLYRTTDGGETWQYEGDAPGCGSVCAEFVDFVNPLDGWREVISATAGAVLTASTDDGGMSWSPIANPSEWPSSGLPSLSGAEDGFIADTLPPDGALPTTGNSLGHFSPLWATTDGGATWHQDDISLPEGYTTAEPYVGLPTFFGGNGVLPIALFKGSSTAIAFYTSTDAGVAWSLRSVEPTTSLLYQGETQWPAISSLSSNLDGAFPAVGVAGPGIWWIASGAWPNDPEVQVTTNFGSSWSTATATGLSPLISSIQPLSATTAWASVDSGGCGLVGTSDSGATWYPICPGTS